MHEDYNYNETPLVHNALNPTNFTEHNVIMKCINRNRHKLGESETVQRYKEDRLMNLINCMN